MSCMGTADHEEASARSQSLAAALKGVIPGCITVALIGQTLTSGGSFFMVGGSHTGHFLNNGLESSCSPKEEKMKPGLSYGMEFPLASAAIWRLVPDMTIPGASLEPTTSPGAKYLECPDMN